MRDLDLFSRFAVALVIGVLVGLQREFSFEKPEKELFGGVRTFALVALIGSVAALSAEMLGTPLVFIAFALIVGAFLSITYFIDASRGDVGLTTEASAVVTFMAGALAYWGELTLAVALGVITTVLLSLKLETQRFVERLTREDIYATLKFAVITAVILPLLPNQDFGPPPFDIFNPYKIWLLVVLISAMNFVGYVLVKIVGPKKGIGLTGLLGGLASSTAVTLTFTQRSKTSQATRELAKPLALAIIIAWTVMFSRLLIEIAAVNPVLLASLWPPVGASVLVGLLYSAYLYFGHRQIEDQEIVFSNPFNLGPAIKFGLIFIVVLLISRAAQVYFGDPGIYLSSLVSGLADVDAIALSVAELSLSPGEVAERVAVQAIILAAVANTFAKGVIVLIGGSPELRRAILPGYLLMMATGIVVVFLF
ncbi:MAG: MgtC/SapB family protein [Anaerolineales bacterium]|jgi:uncharacterized membrane protein (DUF4010 family)